MSVTYARDRRVVQVSTGEYRLPDGAWWWTILRENDLWNAYDQEGRYCREASAKATADEAIAAIIGDPQ